jgi:hypothetical protein
VQKVIAPRFISGLKYATIKGVRTKATKCAEVSRTAKQKNYPTKKKNRNWGGKNSKQIPTCVGMRATINCHCPVDAGCPIYQLQSDLSD